MKLLAAITASLCIISTPALAETDIMSNFLWVPCYLSNNVYKINISSHQVDAIIPVGGGPAGIAVGYSNVYVTCRYSSRLYCISKSDDVVIDSFELAPELAFGIGVAVDPADNIYVVGRVSPDAYAMDGTKIVKLTEAGSVINSLNLLDIQAACDWDVWNQMCVIGIAIRAPQIMIPWQRSWDVNTGIIFTDTSLTSYNNHPIEPHNYGYRGAGAAFDVSDRGWSSGMRESANYLIDHSQDNNLRYHNLGYWDSGAQVMGDVAVDNSGKIWTGNAIGNVVSFNPAIDTSKSYSVGYNQIKGIAIDRLGFIWIAVYPLNALVKFNTNGIRVGESVPVGNLPLGYGDMTGHEFGRRTPVEEEDMWEPRNISLSGAYPNPFNGATNIFYDLGEHASVNIEIYNILGQRIAVLFDGIQEEGRHIINWNADVLNSGIYFVKIQTAESAEKFRIVLLR